MAETDTQDPKVDKLTGQEYDKASQPLISKKGILIVGGMFVVYTALLVGLSLLTGGNKTSAKEARTASGDGSENPAQGETLPSFDPLYQMGAAAATVPVANTTRMVTVGSVYITIDETKAPGLGAMILDKKRGDDVKQRVLIVVENMLRSHEYEHLRQPGIKDKLQAVLPKMIAQELGLKEGAIKKVYLSKFRLPQ